MKTRLKYIMSVLIVAVMMLSVHQIEAKKKKADPAEEADLHYRMGEDYFNRGDYLSALRELTQAVQMNKKNAEAFYYLGTTNYFLKRYTEAEQHLKTAIELKKGNEEGYPEAHNNLGNVYLEVGRYDDAILEFNKCLTFIYYQPNFPKVYFNLGVAFMKKGDMVKAEENFRQATKMDINFCPAYLNLGDIYSRAKRYQESLLEYQKVIDICPISPVSARARIYMGVELNEMGKRKEACEQFYSVIKEMPSTEFAIKAGEYIRIIQCK